MSDDVLARIERHQRQLQALPTEVREACWSDSQNLWVRVSDPKKFQPIELATLAENGFYIELSPVGGHVLDLSEFLSTLELFEGVRLSSEGGERSYVGLELIGLLENARSLRIDFEIENLDLSGLKSLQHLNCVGEASVTAFELPSLETFTIEIPNIPDGRHITAPVKFLWVISETLTDLSFVANSSMVVSLKVTNPYFDLDWLDSFSGLKFVEFVADNRAFANKQKLCVPPGYPKVFQGARLVLRPVLRSVAPQAGYCGTARRRRRELLSIHSRVRRA